MYNNEHWHDSPEIIIDSGLTLQNACIWMNQFRLCLTITVPFLYVHFFSRHFLIKRSVFFNHPAPWMSLWIELIRHVKPIWNFKKRVYMKLYHLSMELNIYQPSSFRSNTDPSHSLIRRTHWFSLVDFLGSFTISLFFSRTRSSVKLKHWFFFSNNTLNNVKRLLRGEKRT